MDISKYTNTCAGQCIAIVKILTSLLDYKNRVQSIINTKEDSHGCYE